MNKIPKKVYINVDVAREDSRAFFKYIDSDRSDGKTTLMVRMAYDEFKASGKIAVLARRWAGDITKQAVDTLFINLKKVRPHIKACKATGSPKKDGVHLFADDEEFAVLIPLSRANACKSAFDVATHKNLYIDEYVPLNKRYAPEEVAAILELYRTIDRDTFTNEIWVFSNHTSNSNPIFSYFDITPRDGVSHWKNGRFILLRVANKGNRAAVKSSPLGELTEGTSYGDYAAGGSLENYDNIIYAKHDRARLPFVLYDTKYFALYHSSIGLVLDYVEPKAGEIIYTSKPNAGKHGGIYLPAAKELCKSLRIRFHNSQIFAASEKVLTDAQNLWKIFEKL